MMEITLESCDHIGPPNNGNWQALRFPLLAKPIVIFMKGTHHDSYNWMTLSCFHYWMVHGSLLFHHLGDSHSASIIGATLITSLDEPYHNYTLITFTSLMGPQRFSSLGGCGSPSWDFLTKFNIIWWHYHDLSIWVSLAICDAQILQNGQHIMLYCIRYFTSYL